MTTTMTAHAQPLFLYADIETIPSRDPDVMREIIDKHATEPLDESAIKPAANLTDPAKIAADLEKRLEKARAEQVEKVDKAARATDEEYRKTCLDATTGHIACISAALGDGAVFNRRNRACDQFGFSARLDEDPILSPDLDTVLDGEGRMLCDFFDAVELSLLDVARVTGVEEIPIPTVVVHHAQFDIRYIWQRAVILGVAVPSWWPVHARPWDTDRIDDTMLAWAGSTGRIGLDRLCRALGIPGKPDDIDGSKVWDAVREGRINDVVSYCDGDVERLRAVHRRIRGLPMPARDDYDAWLSPVAADEGEAA